jgi:hypothetical protein
MGLFNWALRGIWKKAVVIEVQKKHGMNLRAVGDIIGAGRLEEILNAQFELTKGTPAAGALNVEKFLFEVHRIDLQALGTIAGREKKRNG